MSYQPHSTTTQHAYEEFLRDVRRWVPPGLDSVLSFAEDLIDLIQQGKRNGTSNLRDEINGHFGGPLPQDAIHRMVERALQLTDFVGSANTRDDDDEELLSSAGGDSSSSEDEKDDGLRDTVDSSIDGDEDGEDDLGYQRIPFLDVAGNSRFLLEAMRRLFPSSTPADCQIHETKVLNFLRERGSDAGVVETQLTACLGAYDDESIGEWITSAVESRWTIVYGLAYANSSTQVEKDRVIAALLEHAKIDRDAEALYVEITGRDINGGHTTAGGQDDDDTSDNFVNHLKAVDIRGLQFSDERSPFRNTKIAIPRGIQFETHQEIVLPPSELFRGEVKRTSVTEFPDWARPAFPDYMTSLNRMQSIVYPCAFTSSENMLVCAPTGAGKTNVAMMSILRCLANVYRPATGTFDVSELKMVYVAPMKALVQEVVQTFSKRLNPLGISVAELSGDASLSKQQLAETQLIVTTPEKWDVVTRKSMDLGVAALVRLIIIDEIHLLHNDRGPVLEAIVARFKLQSRQQQQRGGDNDAQRKKDSYFSHTRFVGLSATLPNYEDVASFMQVDRNKGLFHFDSSFREVPLRQTYCQAFKVKGMNSAEVLNTVAYKKAMEHAHHEQVMVFVHSRKDTEFTATFMLQKARFENKADSIMRPGSDSERAVHEAIAEVEASGGTVREALKQLLPRGFAVHHAGMSREERSLVEDLFLHRHLKVLVCTSTLAWGVNLPANAVVVKGTQVFSAEKGGTTLLSVLDVLQMFGRAGRVGFGSALGEACIITSTPEDLSYYLGALNQQLPIESRFLDRVIDALNAEVVLGSVRSIADAAQWLQCTYFYVRMRQHPQLYGTKGPTTRDPMCLQHVHNIAHTAALHLHSSKLIEYDQNSKALRSTELGRIASHYYLVHESMRTYQQHMWEGMHETDLFQLFSLSHEFTHISVRPDEGAQLRELLACCPIAVSDGPTTTAAKVNVLLQCYISNMSLIGLPLMSELVYIKDSAQRILRALYDIAVERGYGLTARSVLRMFLMVLHRQWAVQSPLRQVRKLMASQTFQTIVDTLESRRVDWETLQDLSLEDLQELLKRDRVAEAAHECIRRVPRYKLQVAARPLTRKLLNIDLDITPFYNYDDELHNASRELLLTIEHNNGTILHHESIFLPRDRLQHATDDGASGPCVQMTIGVPLVDPKPCYYFVRCVSPAWIGCEAVAPVSLMNITVPAPKLPNIEMEDISPTTTADDEEDGLLVEKMLKPYHLDAVGAQFFSFPAFTKLQANALEAIFADESPDIFAGVPMGAGKTTLAELFALRFLLDRNSTDSARPQLLYVTATNTVASRRFEEWSYKFQELLSNDNNSSSTTTANIVQLTAASALRDDVAQQLANAAIIITSPDGITPLLRRGGEGLHGVTYMVVDHAHLLRDTRLRAFECCISRLLSPPYLLNHGARRPRLLVLSLPTANCEDLCRWLKIKVAFNYGKSFWRFQTQLVGCEVGGYHNRYAQATLFAVRGILAAHGGASKLVFVPSAKDALDFAEQLVTARAKKQQSSPMEEGGVAIPSDVTDEIEDKETRLLLEQHAIGLITTRTSVGDIALQLSLVEDPPTSPSGTAVGVTVIATFESAWRLPAAVFDHCVICLPERSAGSASSLEADELGAQLHADCSISETLQMVSRGRTGCTLYCRRSQRWVLHQFLNEPLPVESCNRDAYDFRETINAAIAQGYVHSMNDVLSVLKTHYIFQHLKGNPSFHGLTHDSERPRHLSAIAGRAVLSLANDLNCIEYDGSAFTVKASSRGVAAAFHCISMDTLEMLSGEEMSTSSGGMSNVSSILLGVCRAEEISLGSLRDVTIIRRHEAAALQVAARTLRSSFDVSYLNLDYSAPETKAYLLMLMRCSRWKWEGLSEQVYGAASRDTVAPAAVLAQLDNDADVVVPIVLQVLRSAVELVDRKEAICIRNMMCLAQCIQRRVWIDDSEVSQLSTVQKFPDLLDAWTGARTLDALIAAAASPTAITEWAGRWRPQLSNEKQVERKIAVITTLLSEDITNVPQMTTLSARAELQEVSEGTFVCVVSITSTIAFQQLQQQQNQLPHEQEEAWVVVESTTKVDAAPQKTLGARTAWYMPSSSPHTSALQSRIVFPLEEIEDEDNVELRVRIALTGWRVMGDSAVPME